MHAVWMNEWKLAWTHTNFFSWTLASQTKLAIEEWIGDWTSFNGSYNRKVFSLYRNRHLYKNHNPWMDSRICPRPYSSGNRHGNGGGEGNGPCTVYHRTGTYLPVCPPCTSSQGTSHIRGPGTGKGYHRHGNCCSVTCPLCVYRNEGCVCLCEGNDPFYRPSAKASGFGQFL